MTQTPRNFGLDLLRCAAIIGVLGRHYPFTLPAGPISGTMRIYGWSGVDLFFVLSGYLIASQLIQRLLASSEGYFRKFYVRRATRILPSYLVVLGIYSFLPSWGEAPVISPLWKYLTFTQNIDLHIERWPGFTHAWSLCVEEHFYLLFPVILALLWKIRPRTSVVVCGIVALLAFEIALRAWIGLTYCDSGWRSFHRLIYAPTGCRLDGLTVGCSLALIERLKPAWWARLSRARVLLFVAGLALIAGCAVLSRELFSMKTALFGFSGFSIGFGMLLVFLKESLPSVQAGWIARPVRFVAEQAYCMYLSHKIALHWAGVFAARAGFEIAGIFPFLGAMAWVLVVAALLRALVEKPGLKWGRLPRLNPAETG